MRVLFFTRSLEYGGSQKQLLTLARGLQQRGFERVSVAVFYGGGDMEDVLRKSDIQVHVLNKIGRWDIALFTIRFVRLVRMLRPDMVYGFLDTPNVLIAMLKPFLGDARIIWGIRSAYVDWSRYDWLAKMTHKFMRRFARFADKIIVNSRAGRECLVRQGYEEANICLIPNGIDLDSYFVDPQSRQNQRREWNIMEGQLVIGIVARLDPMKDYETFMTAAGLFIRQHPGCMFVCVGKGSEEYTRHLHMLSIDEGLSESIIWVSESKNLRAVYNALDIFTLSSYGEAFPNVIGEAMACGVPCVVTDAGDSAWLVDGVGVVVPAKDPAALAHGWAEMSEKSSSSRKALGDASRRRIENEFSKDLLVSRTQAALSLLEKRTDNS